MRYLMMLLCMVIVSVSSYVQAEEEKPFDCSEHEGTTWQGQITNPSDVPHRIQLFSNEIGKDKTLIGLPGPYFTKVMQAGETVTVNYQCGENSAIYKDMDSNSYKAMDFHVPGTFLDGENEKFKMELNTKKSNV
jgi:hypothetical protein